MKIAIARNDPSSYFAKAKIVALQTAKKFSSTNLFLPETEAA